MKGKSRYIKRYIWPIIYHGEQDRGVTLKDLTELFFTFFFNNTPNLLNYLKLNLLNYLKLNLLNYLKLNLLNYLKLSSYLQYKMMVVTKEKHITIWINQI